MAQNSSAENLPADESLLSARQEIDRLRATCERLIDFMSTASDLLWETDSSRRLISGRIPRGGSVNGAHLEEADTTLAAAFRGRTLAEIQGFITDKTVLDAHEDNIRNRRPFRNLEYSLQLPDGRLMWLESSGNPVFDREGLFRGYRGTARDITKRKTDEALVSFLARHDSLTNLPNRVLLRERLEAAMAEDLPGACVAVICLDLDRFKVVNDTLGHARGDLLLRILGERLVGCVRGIDTVARIGGDEFAVILRAVDHSEQVTALTHRILEAINQPCELDGHCVTPRASAGIAIAPHDGTDSVTVLTNADIALYRAKGEDAGAMRFFEPEMGEKLKYRQSLEVDLAEAVRRGEFELVYQPLCDAHSCRINAFEALLRWRHPGRGENTPARVVPPDEFIPIAEETGLIIPIGEWVLRQACKDAAIWPGDVRVAVNLSPVQFRSRRLVTAVKEALAHSGLAASRLELEITEAVLMQDSEQTLHALHEFRRLGASISMDDFGTGHSSLGYLRSFPFDKIKIDRSFVRDLTKAEGAAAIVRAIAGLGASLSLQTVAEGVETLEQLAIVQSEGCTEVQGYLFSKPIPACEVALLLEHGPFQGRTHVPVRASVLARLGWDAFTGPFWNPRPAQPLPDFASDLPSPEFHIDVACDGNIFNGEPV